MLASLIEFIGFYTFKDVRMNATKTAVRLSIESLEDRTVPSTSPWNIVRETVVTSNVGSQKVLPGQTQVPLTRGIMSDSTGVDQKLTSMTIGLANGSSQFTADVALAHLFLDRNGDGVFDRTEEVARTRPGSSALHFNLGAAGTRVPSGTAFQVTADILFAAPDGNRLGGIVTNVGLRPVSGLYAGLSLVQAIPALHKVEAPVVLPSLVSLQMTGQSQARLGTEFNQSAVIINNGSASTSALDVQVVIPRGCQLSFMSIESHHAVFVYDGGSVVRVRLDELSPGEKVVLHMGLTSMVSATCIMNFTATDALGRTVVSNTWVTQIV